MSLLDDAIDQAERTLALLHAARDHAEDRIRLAVAGAPTAPESAGDVEPDVAPADDDPNALPFKCPGCGATYEKQVECTNGHPAEQTLPTQEVLDGAKPADPAATPAVEAIPDTNAVVETGTTPPPAAVPGGDEGSPTWPAGTA